MDEKLRTRLSLLLLVALLAAPAAAEAVIPAGNLLTNPGAEDGPAATAGTEVVVPAGWFLTSGDGAGPTALEYGAPGGFPDTALGASIAGGRSFFAGGHSSDENEYISQTIVVSAAAPEIQAGQVQAAVTGCLGGRDAEGEVAQFEVEFWGAEPELGFPDPHEIDNFMLIGPNPAERRFVTKFLPQDAAGTVPRATGFIVVKFSNSLADPPYADGYADNLTLHLEPVGSPERQATCSPPVVQPPPGGDPGSGGGDGGNPAGGGGSSERGVAGSGLPIGLGTTRAVLSSSSVQVRLRCLLQGRSCDGSLSLSVPRLPRPQASAAAVRLGTKRFSIRGGTTGTVKVTLSRRARGRFRAISRRQLRRVRLDLRVRIGGEENRFRVPLTRAR